MPKREVEVNIGRTVRKKNVTQKKRIMWEEITEAEV
jgi:hypothetical protein